MGHSSPWGRLSWRLLFVSSECETKPISTRALAWVAKMGMQQAITAKRTTKPPTEPTPIGVADRLDALGRLLYGQQWITPMARDLKIDPDMIAEWAWGRRELPPDHPIFAALAVLVHHHDKGVAKAREIMDRNIVGPRPQGQGRAARLPYDAP
jgi:hypothetical protein